MTPNTSSTGWRPSKTKGWCESNEMFRPSCSGACRHSSVPKMYSMFRGRRGWPSCPATCPASILKGESGKETPGDVWRHRRRYLPASDVWTPSLAISPFRTHDYTLPRSTGMHHIQQGQRGSIHAHPGLCCVLKRWSLGAQIIGRVCGN